jgi:hypothetical protein
MFLNTYQHGYQDAIRGNGPFYLEPSDGYQQGYDAGTRYRATDRMMQLIALGALAITMGGVLTTWIAQGVAVAV